MKSSLPPATAAILAIGDELLRDRTDTNGPAIQNRLARAGIETRVRLVLPDDERVIAEALNELIGKQRVIICCGGLGPTQDDVTRQAVARAVRQPLVLYPALLDKIKKRFQLRGLVMPANNRVQAMCPRGAVWLPNAWGTAQGFYVKSGLSRIAVLPGPPRECLPMLEQELLPRMRTSLPRSGTGMQEILMRACGVSESDLQERMGAWFQAQPGLELGFLLDEPGEILMRLTSRRPARQAKQLLEQARRFIRQQVALNLVDAQGKPLPEVIGRILRRQRQTLAVAESCTGGRIAARVTGIPGSSAYFLEGAVTYSNQSKIRRLGISRQLLARHGAVSEAVALAMAQGIRQRGRADWGLAVTGLAGPGGGSRAKPVGLVHIALAGPRRYEAAKSLRFPGERAWVQRLSAAWALDFLRRALLNQKTPALRR